MKNINKTDKNLGKKIPAAIIAQEQNSELLTSSNSSDTQMMSIRQKQIFQYRSIQCQILTKI